MVSLAQLKQRKLQEQRRQELLRKQQQAANRSIEIARTKLNKIVQERTRKFGTNPSRSTRRGRTYKLLTAEVRALNNIITELNQAKARGVSISESDLNKAIRERTALEKRKTRGAVRRLAERKGVKLNFGAQTQAAKDLTQAAKKNPKVQKAIQLGQTQKAFNEAGLGGLTKILTPKQQEQVLRAAATTSFPKDEKFLTAPVIPKIDRVLAPKKGDNTLTQIGKGVSSSLVQNARDLKELGKLILSGSVFDIKTIKGIGAGTVVYARNTLTSLQRGNPFEVAKAFTDVSLFFIPATKFKVKPKIANMQTKWSSKFDIKTGKVRMNLDTKGLTQANENFIQVAKLTYNPKTKQVTGVVESKVGKTTTKERVNLRDEGGFYVDPKTKIKIPKSRLAAAESNIRIKEIKSTQKTADTPQIKGDINAVKGTRTITTKDIVIAERAGVRATRVTERVSTADFLRDLVQRNKVIATKVKPLVRTKVTSLKKFQQRAGLTDKQIKNFLESIGYRKDIIQGIDKRTRIARALGLRKESKFVKTFETIIEKEGGTVITRKGTVKLKGIDEVVNPILARIGISNPKLKGTGKLTKKQLDDIGRIPRKIDVPELRFRLKAIKKLNTRGLISTRFLGKTTKRLNSKIDSLLRAQKPLKKTKPITTTKVVPTKKVEKVPLKKRVKAPVTRKTTTTKVVTKKLPLRAVPTPRPRLTPAKVKPLKVRLPKLEFGTPLPKGTRLKFDFRYREKGRVKIAKVGLPLNKAIAKAGRLIDNTTGRSMELVISGITKQKDIKKPNIIKKFKPRKTKKALRLVEKSRNTIDTRGEKRGLSISKALKPKKRKKTTKKSKK